MASECGVYSYRARYYDPLTGRFLSEDPLQFSASVNFYPYALNDPSRFHDPLGLSAQDVQRILSDCQKCTDKLTATGERRAGSGWPSGAVNNLQSFFSLGFVHSGCTRQADLTAACLSVPSSPWDTHWDFSVVSTHLGFHHVTVGRSNDPSDPLVVCDPWTSTSTTLPRGAAASAGGGTAGGGGGPF